MYRNILMPVDVFNMDLTDKAIAHADFLARGAGAKIHLLHVFPKSSSAILPGFASDIGKFEEYMTKEATAKMRDLACSFKTPLNRIESIVRFGSVRDEVNQVAQDIDADVVIIGSRSPGLATHLLGSTAENVVNHARLPVFVVR
ncbi:universal stress protein [Entomohabitans teleogrylli]|uniref:universal stress protein n=1 Tax=Entomohabitans teleogrylli TaxID=1384589 RepID=UPI00073D3DA9|nr:universal stress protein [Entomohabitans teleogrylli]